MENFKHGPSNHLTTNTTILPYAFPFHHVGNKDLTNMFAKNSHTTRKIVQEDPLANVIHTKNLSQHQNLIKVAQLNTQLVV